MRVLRHVSSVPRYLVGALMIVITFLVNVEVGFRFLLNLPLDAISEIVLLLFPWLTLLGAAVAINRVGTNVALHLLSGRLTEQWKKRLGGFGGLATLAFGVFLIVQGIRFAWMTRGELSNVLDISRSWEILAFPVAGMLFILFSLPPILALLHWKPVVTGAGSRTS